MLMILMVMTMMLTEFKWCLSAEGQRWGIRAGRAALARLPVFPAFDAVFVVVLGILLRKYIRAGRACFLWLFWTFMMHFCCSLQYFFFIRDGRAAVAKLPVSSHFLLLIMFLSFSFL